MARPFLLRSSGNAGMMETRCIEAAKAGDRMAFDRLAAQHLEGLRGFVRSRVPTGLVDEVVQETLLAAWTSLASFGGRSGFKTWLFAIATHKCRDLRRGEKPVEREDDRLGAAEPEFARIELRVDVGRALAQLSAENVELLNLYYGEQYTLQEIAKRQGANLNTVKYRFYRAHEEFRKLLGDMP